METEGLGYAQLDGCARPYFTRCYQQAVDLLTFEVFCVVGGAHQTLYFAGR